MKEFPIQLNEFPGRYFVSLALSSLSLSHFREGFPFLRLRFQEPFFSLSLSLSRKKKKKEEEEEEEEEEKKRKVSC